MTAVEKVCSERLKDVPGCFEAVHLAVASLQLVSLFLLFGLTLFHSNVHVIDVPKTDKGGQQNNSR